MQIAPSRSLPAYERIASSPRRMISCGGSFGPESSTSAPELRTLDSCVIFTCSSVMLVRRLRSGGSDWIGFSASRRLVRLVSFPSDDGRERSSLCVASSRSSDVQ